MVKSEGAMDQWYAKVKRDHILIARAYASCEEVEETPREYRRAAGDTLVVGFQAGVFRPFTIIRIDHHVATDALRRLTTFGRRKWQLDVHLDRVTTWRVFDNVVKAADAWRRLRAALPRPVAGGGLPVFADYLKRRMVTLGPFAPRIVTETLICAGAFRAARDAHWHDIAMLNASGVTVAREPMDEHTRERLWVIDLIPVVDAETHAATMAKLARALDMLARESADPGDREWCQLRREALNNTRRNG